MNSFREIIITLLILIFVFIIPGIFFIYFYFKKFEVFFIPAFLSLFITFGIYTFIWKKELVMFFATILIIIIFNLYCR